MLQSKLVTSTSRVPQMERVIEPQVRRVFLLYNLKLMCIF